MLDCQSGSRRFKSTPGQKIISKLISFEIFFWDFWSTFAPSQLSYNESVGRSDGKGVAKNAEAKNEVLTITPLAVSQAGLRHPSSSPSFSYIRKRTTEQSTRFHFSWGSVHHQHSTVVYIKSKWTQSIRTHGTGWDNNFRWITEGQKDKGSLANKGLLSVSPYTYTFIYVCNFLLYWLKIQVFTLYST